MQRILVIEDSLEIQKVIVGIFRKSHDVLVASHLKEARELIRNSKFDLVLLDLNLPDGLGFSFLAELNADPAHKDLPVFLLTGDHEDHNKLQAFQLGAQDYILKPFSHVELKARVEARLRRTHAPDILSRGNLTLDLGTQRVSISGADNQSTCLDLSSLEFKLLIYLCRQEDRVVSRDQIMQTVWGGQTHVLDRTVDAHVSRLRKKLHSSEFNVQTIIGAGYTFRQNPTSYRKKAA